MANLYWQEGLVMFSGLAKVKSGPMPISPHCLVIKITNDSVHFILPLCLALPLDTHWIFQCEQASWALCCCSVWPHRLVRLFWYHLSSQSEARPHQRIRTWISGLDSLWWAFFISSSTPGKFIERDWQHLTINVFSTGGSLDSTFRTWFYANLGLLNSAWKTHHQGEQCDIYTKTCTLKS